MTFENATEEFLPIAKELYEKHCKTLNLCIEPELVLFLRADSRKKAYAYCKIVAEEYESLTDKKFIIVIVNDNFNALKTEEEKRYVILHEMKHLFVTDSGKYKLLDHDLKEFQALLQNPAWNLRLVEDEKPKEEQIIS